MSELGTSPLVRPAPVSRKTPAVPPWLLVVVAVISVQMGAAVAKQLFDVAGPAGTVFIRTLLAGILFCFLWRPDVRAFWRQGPALIIAYGINIAAMMLVFYATIQRIPLGVAVAISFAGPLGLAVAGSRRPLDFLWILCAVVGILLLSPLANVELDPVGVGLALISALSWATFVLLTTRIIRRFDGNGNAALALSMCVAALAVLPFGLVGAVSILAHPPLILIAIAVALFSSAIPFILEFQALKSLRPGVFGLLISVEPVAAAIVGFLVLQEALGLRELGGIVLVTIAAVATARSG